MGESSQLKFFFPTKIKQSAAIPILYSAVEHRGAQKKIKQNGVISQSYFHFQIANNLEMIILKNVKTSFHSISIPCIHF